MNWDSCKHVQLNVNIVSNLPKSWGIFRCVFRLPSSKNGGWRKYRFSTEPPHWHVLLSELEYCLGATIASVILNCFEAMLTRMWNVKMCTFVGEFLRRNWNRLYVLEGGGTGPLFPVDHGDSCDLNPIDGSWLEILHRVCINRHGHLGFEVLLGVVGHVHGHIFFPAHLYNNNKISLCYVSSRIGLSHFKTPFRMPLSRPWRMLRQLW